MCSKPQSIDAALLRPGRFDRLILCDFPGWHERLEILKVHSREVSSHLPFCLLLIFLITGFAICELLKLLIS